MRSVSFTAMSSTYTGLVGGEIDMKHCSDERRQSSRPSINQYVCETLFGVSSLVSLHAKLLSVETLVGGLRRHLGYPRHPALCDQRL